MLKVIVELHPFGSGRRRRRILEFYIGNDGSGDALVGNYVVGLENLAKGGTVLARVRRHQRGKGVLPLLARSASALARRPNGGV